MENKKVNFIVTPEILEQARQYIEVGLDYLIKNDPGYDMLYTAAYWTYMNLLIITDMVDLIYKAHENHIKSLRFDKNTVLSDLDNIPYVSIKEFFTYMRKIDDMSRRDVMDCIEGLGLATKERLYNSVINDDFHEFEKIITETNYDFVTSSKMAHGIYVYKNVCTANIQTLNSVISEENYPYLAEYVKSKFPDIERINFIPFENLNDEELEIVGQFQKWQAGYYKVNLDVFLSNLPEIKRKLVISKIPSKTYEAYLKIDYPDDKEMIDSLMTNNDEKTWVFQLERQIKSNRDDKQEELILYPHSKYSFIPENYFDENNKPSGIHEEYFNTELFNESFRNGKLEEFVTLINYLCDMRYIENNNRTKAILAYRLTGLNRPSGEVIEKIDWDTSEPSKLYSLLYLIRHWTRHMNPKYSKCLDFFNNIQAGDIANGSSKTKDATNEFQDFLNKLYGNDLFPIEHEKQRKALKKTKK